MSKLFKLIVLIMAGIFILQTAACGAPEIAEEVTGEATQAPTEEPTFLNPGEPPESARTLEDVNSSIKASENRTLSGDKFLENLYERPFTSQEMVYQPELDIYTVDIAQDDNFFYFTITLNPGGLELNELFGVYGIEFDRTKTGRGDLLVLTQGLLADWSTDNVSVYIDTDEDVGGPKPMIADAGFEGNGYDQQVELAENKVAWSRISPEDANALQIAVSRTLMDNPEEFLWSAWADDGLKDVTLFDYNDTMGPSMAGSPLRDDKNYPIKNLYSVDNTCRLPYGFEPKSSEVPGMCLSVTVCERYCVKWCYTPQRVKYCCEYGCK
jgi:hypothetical protein